MSWLNWFRQKRNKAKQPNAGSKENISSLTPKQAAAIATGDAPVTSGPLNPNSTTRPAPAVSLPVSVPTQANPELTALVQKEREREKEANSAAPLPQPRQVVPTLLPATTSGGVAPSHIQAALAIPAALLPQVKMPIRVLLVDDDSSLRAHIRQYLLTQANPTGTGTGKPLSGPGQLFEIVGEAANGRVGLDLIGELSPDIVLFDINMPYGGVELAKEIHQKYPAQRRIVLSSNLDVTYAQMFFHLEVQGYLHKACSMQELRTALFSVMAGGVWLTWALDSDPQDAAGLKAAIAAFVKVLTSEERRYLQMFLLKGGSDSHLAQGLGITVQKAAEYRSRFFTALGVSQRITLVLDGVYWMMALTGKHLEPVAPASDALLAELGQQIRAASQRRREQLKLLKVKEQQGPTRSERPGGK